MKKITKKLAIFGSLFAIICTTFVASIISSNSSVSKKEIPVFAIGETNESGRYIPFTTANFTPSSENSGEWGAPRTRSLFWGTRSFNALDNFFRGETNEGWTGTITSTTWTQKNPYITFTLGGNPYDGENVVNYVQFLTRDSEGKEVEVGRVANLEFKDNELSNNMIVKYFEIPSSYESQLETGLEMYCRLVDAKTGGFGFLNFGALRVSQTKNDVIKTISAHKNGLSRNSADEAARAWTLSVYNKEEYASFTNLSNFYDVSDDFEEGYGLTGYGWDTTYTADVDTEGTNTHFDTAIANVSNHWNNNDLPFNKTGNYFFKGFYEGNEGNIQGFAASDAPRYRLLSPSFKLGGTGFISVKMGGSTASLHVLNGDSSSGNYLQELAFIDKKEFKIDADASNVAISGFNSCTMVRHIINLNAFKDQIICLGIADVGNAGWGAVNFDELITYYPSNPTFKVDVATQNTNEIEKHPYYLDHYVSRTNADIIYTVEETRNAETVDNTVVLEASNFLSSYYASARAKSNAVTFCGEGFTSENKNALLEAYNALSADAKAIVNNSMDISYGVTATSDNWYTLTPDTSYTVGQGIDYLNDSINVSKSHLFLFGNSNNSVENNIYIVVICLAVIASILLIAFISKKKKASK